MTYEEYLAHHGILGMKWGKRNGPPYPLGSDQMTAMERAKNDVSEYAAKAYAARKKAKIREKERVRKNKVKEKEQIRQNKVEEKEIRRQNRVDEREMSRQNRVDEKELDKQNDAKMAENWEQYKRGRSYVKKFLIGAGIMTVAGLAIYKATKSGKVDVSTSAQTVKDTANNVSNTSLKNGNWPKWNEAVTSFSGPNRAAGSAPASIDLGKDYVKRTLSKTDIEYMAPERLKEVLMDYAKKS